jgi:hypothetical protein
MPHRTHHSTRSRRIESLRDILHVLTDFAQLARIIIETILEIH